MKKLTFIMAGLILFLGLAAYRAEASANEQTLYYQAFTDYVTVPEGYPGAIVMFEIYPVENGVCNTTHTGTYGNVFVGCQFLDGNGNEIKEFSPGQTSNMLLVTIIPDATPSQDTDYYFNATIFRATPSVVKKGAVAPLTYADILEIKH